MSGSKKRMAVSLLAGNNFIVVNKTMLKAFGVDEAIMLGELSGEYDYWATRGGLDDEGYFYSTVENVKGNTTLSKHKQKKALDALKNLGVVDVKRKGIPAKRYVKIFKDKIIEILAKKDAETSGSSRRESTSTKKLKNATYGRPRRKRALTKKLRSATLKSQKNEQLINNNKEALIKNKKEKVQKKSCSLPSSPGGGEELPPPPRPKSKIGTLNQLIDEYTDSKELRRELKHHLKVRAAKKGALVDRAIELSFKTLDKLGHGNEEKIKIVQRSIERGWIGFFPLPRDCVRLASGNGASYNIEEFESNYGNYLERILNNHVSGGSKSLDGYGRRC